MPADGKQALIDYVAGGKGLIGLHCATDTFHSHGNEVDQYIKLLGGEFVTHGNQQVSTIHVAEGNFPGAPAKDATFAEEWYSLKNFADDLDVILVPADERDERPDVPSAATYPQHLVPEARQGPRFLQLDGPPPRRLDQPGVHRSAGRRTDFRDRPIEVRAQTQLEDRHPRCGQVIWPPDAAATGAPLSSVRRRPRVFGRSLHSHPSIGRARFLNPSAGSATVSHFSDRRRMWLRYSARSIPMIKYHLSRNSNNPGSGTSGVSTPVHEHQHRFEPVAEHLFPLGQVGDILLGRPGFKAAPARLVPARPALHVHQ